MVHNFVSAQCIIKLLSFCGLLLLAHTAAAMSSPQLQLQGPNSTVKEGYFNVSVHLSGSQDQPALNNLRIQAASSADFKQVQEFPALGEFKQWSLTGFSNGDYYLRAVADNLAKPSNTIQVSVQHYPLWQALSLFAIGFVVFATLVITLLRLHLKAQQQEGVHD